MILMMINNNNYTTNCTSTKNKTIKTSTDTHSQKPKRITRKSTRKLYHGVQTTHSSCFFYFLLLLWFNPKMYRSVLGFIYLFFLLIFAWFDRFVYKITQPRKKNVNEFRITNLIPLPNMSLFGFWVTWSPIKRRMTFTMWSHGYSDESLTNVHM